MLNARYLATISDDLVELYAELEGDIKRDMFRRLNTLQHITDATRWQAEILKQTGQLKLDIQKYVAKYDKKVQKQLAEMFTDAINEAEQQDLRYYQMGKRYLSKEQTQIMNASIDRLENAEKINKTFNAMQNKAQAIYESLTRMTLTVADATEKEFLKQCNAAYMKVSSGAFSWQSAYKTAVDNLATNGVKTVFYSQSGKLIERSIESATRMNIITGINQTASQQTLENADNLGTDLVEVSAHIGARPEHEEFQGKVYCLSGEKDYVDADGITRHAEDFYKVCRLGEVDGICGINCRHSFYPYFPGTPLQYSRNELDEMSDKRVNLDGKEITPYEAEQELRLCERNIRNYKSVAEGYNLTGRGDSPEMIKAQNNIYNWQQRAKHITDQTGIRRNYTNEYIGTKSGTQPRGLGGDEARYLKHAKQEFNTSSNFLSNVKQGKPMDFIKANSGNVNPRYMTSEGYCKNCQSSVVTFIARLRGFNVEVLPKVSGSKLETLSHNTSLAWVDKTTGKPPKYVTPNLHRAEKVKSFVSDLIKKGEYYTIEGQWQGSRSGHIINVFRNNQGNLIYYDPQTNEVKDAVAIDNFYKAMNKGTLKLLRVDNCDFNKSIVDFILTKRDTTWKKK